MSDLIRIRVTNDTDHNGRELAVALEDLDSLPDKWRPFVRLEADGFPEDGPEAVDPPEDEVEDEDQGREATGTPDWLSRLSVDSGASATVVVDNPASGDEEVETVIFSDDVDLSQRQDSEGPISDPPYIR